MNQKCENCGDPIIEKPSYVNQMKVCQRCFRRLKVRIREKEVRIMGAGL